MREYDNFADWEMEPFYIFSETIGGIHNQKEMVTIQNTLRTCRTKGSSEFLGLILCFKRQENAKRARHHVQIRHVSWHQCTGSDYTNAVKSYLIVVSYLHISIFVVCALHIFSNN